MPVLINVKEFVKLQKIWNLTFSHERISDRQRHDRGKEYPGSCVERHSCAEGEGKFSQ